MDLTPQRGAVAAGPDDDHHDLDGLTIQAYAQRFDLSVPDVWARLRRGELVGRSEHGRLVIYPSTQAAPPPQISALVTSQASDELDLSELLAAEAEHVTTTTTTTTRHSASRQSSLLPPLPMPEGANGVSSSLIAGSFLYREERSQSPEIALLLDHLSLSKDENREILRMTQESIRKISELSDSIVEMKEKVIDSKETEIAVLRQMLTSQSSEVQKLRQANEDLEMLARTVMAESELSR